MSVTILEALQNANYNIQKNGQMGLMIAKGQLNIAVVLLEKGYSLDDLVEPILEEFGEVENAPQINQNKVAKILFVLTVLALSLLLLLYTNNLDVAMDFIIDLGRDLS